VLRVKPESLRADQPLTDLGLDSLMAVEIETSLEGVIGVALPPASLMRARTINQIVILIAEHMAGPSSDATSAPQAIPAARSQSSEVDLDSISDADIATLLGGDPAPKTLEAALTN
jgi:acyl carrier protein